MINDLPPELQSVITSYLTTPDLCFFAQTSKCNLQAALPLLKERQKMLLCPPHWCMAGGGADISIGYTSRALYACGNNDCGQLGLGLEDENCTTFTRVEDLPGTIQQVVTGDTHTLVLTSHGLYACGRNNCGQLGLGDKNYRTAFTRVKDVPGTIQQVVASGYRTLVLTSQGLYACGSNVSGQLGLGDQKERMAFTRIENLPGTIQQVIAGSNHTLILTSQGLYACGCNFQGRLGLSSDKSSYETFTRVKDLPGTIQQIVAGTYHTLVLTSQGLYACGWNDHGQLGLGDTKYCTTFTRIKDLPGTIQQIVAGSNHTLVLTSQGLYACGDNASGQLGLGDNRTRKTFTRVKNLPGKIQQIVAGRFHTLVLTSQGLYACGWNDHGQLGLGNEDGRRSFASITHLPSEIKRLLALYRQIETLIALAGSNAQTSSQGVHKRKLSRS